jgi:CheY-like chemotaxis protein
MDMSEAYSPLVMIVEDTQYIGELAALILKRIGLEAELCLTAEDAIRYMEEVALPDLIVLDIGMPGMSGWEFLDVIKAYEDTKTIPVIVTTAYSDAANRLIGRLREVDRYLTKPYKPNELQSIVSQILKERGWN